MAILYDATAEGRNRGMIDKMYVPDSLRQANVLAYAQGSEGQLPAEAVQRQVQSARMAGGVVSVEMLEVR